MGAAREVAKAVVPYVRRSRAAAVLLPVTLGETTRTRAGQADARGRRRRARRCPAAWQLRGNGGTCSSCVLLTSLRFTRVVVGMSKLPVGSAGPQVRSTTLPGGGWLLGRVRIRSGQRRELAGLELLLDRLVDVVLARIRVRAAQLPGAHAPQLHDLQHVDEIGARDRRDDEQRPH